MAEFKEEFKVKGQELLDKIKDIVHEGNIRRIIIKNDEGKTIMELPLTFGVIGAVFAPILAAVGAVAALAADYTIEVYKSEEEPEAKKDEQPGN
ncbi:MAG TPA: DUF4342 domain-containing protein [Bacteroidales bacterium]|nr:DUF4342 domain-containing protein [Bacteroidales bacterium]HRZ20097.1 DUF4342 domain-containing protein [Bacteroidales bacterium]